MIDLHSLNDNDLLNYVVEYAFQHEERLGELSVPVQTLYFISNFEAEFYNGGIRQFLTNSSGRFAGETADSFTRIGAPKLAALLQKAVDLSAEGATNDEALDALDNELSAAYPTNEDGNVADQLIAYLRKQSADFKIIMGFCGNN